MQRACGFHRALSRLCLSMAQSLNKGGFMPNSSMVGLILMGMTACSGSGYGDESSAGIVAAVFPDEDGDTILDHHEGSAEGEDLDEDGTPDGLDWDDDGTPDYLDLDSDEDTVSDKQEAGDADPLTFPVDTDLDGTPDYRDLESDGNCISDVVEGGEDQDSDGVVDSSDLDNDGDGIGDLYEIGDLLADCPDADPDGDGICDLELCERPDHDGDGIPDYQDIDSDGDGVGDIFEAGTSEFDDSPNDTDGDGIPDYLDLDSDGDGRSDALEAGVDDPTEEPRDTDGDGLYDFADTDSDNDGLSDWEEGNIYGTDPYDFDSDGDGFNDGAEVAVGSDPNDGGSVIEGIYVEVPERTDVEEVFEFELSIQLGDIAFLLDTTCSMGGTIEAMKDEYADIVDELATTIPEANYAVATFDDYNYGSMGSGTDRPFILKRQLTSNVADVQSTLSSIPLHNGVDWPESSTEALYQAITGGGYDQNRNGSYDSGTDVRPFISSSSDPFSGGGGQAYDSTVVGTGSGGGVGFRAYALPIIVYATDAEMRDAATYSTPGGLPFDANGTGTAAAAIDAGVYLIGIGVGSSAPLGQMNALADMTGSLADTDGDGAADDRLVFSWSGSSSTFRDTVVNAIEDLVDSVLFDFVELDIEGDDHGFVVGVDPERYSVSGAVAGSVIDFTLTFRGTVAADGSDQLFQLTLNVLGNGTTLLDTLDIFVLVPGE
jgi:hypothetical protein